ncbi:SlyX family protein [Pseudomonas sp. RP23018S]|uniref:SlyX family protein n=1 Tax=Pseudomonas sp. RP23018S TaxID=3096037 RepID=UPI002ACA6EE8|nr:SlyX family protein [Pseudomonas sp. RP23018S]MDZ5601307.1 SlyX family protein [Pseudomonas sp. RP23018S]
MTLENQVIELETRQAFQDDNLQTLNQVVFEQARKIERLQQQMQHLLKRYDDLVGQMGVEGDEAPPPHY